MVILTIVKGNYRTRVKNNSTYYQVNTFSVHKDFLSTLRQRERAEDTNMTLISKKLIFLNGQVRQTNMHTHTHTHDR